jgi:hypothetical protein
MFFNIKIFTLQPFREAAWTMVLKRINGWGYQSGSSWG